MTDDSMWCGDSSTFLFPCLYCENNCKRLKNVVLFDVPKTSRRQIAILSRRKWLARVATVSGKIFPLSPPNGRDYVFMNDRPFHFELIKRAPRRIEDTRCFWDLTGNLALRARRNISGQWDTRTFAFCDKYPSRMILIYCDMNFTYICESQCRM